MNTRKISILALLIFGFTGLAYIWNMPINTFPAEDLPQVPGSSKESRKNLSEELEELNPNIEVIGENFTIPWDIVFVDNLLLVTQRTGELVLFDPSSGTRDIIEVPGVLHTGEGGLLGAVLHPNFVENRYIYLYFSTAYAGGTRNTVSRFVYQGGILSQEKVILENIPGAPYHDGGRMAFGPDGMLYITTGDATRPESAQDPSSLSGKILRLHSDGSIPSNNPFGTAVYSYGHRNPQGIAWDDAGRLWSTEHGRSGIRSGLDELNLIRPGINYGWPNSEGDTIQPGTAGPVVHSGVNTTWAPAGTLFYNGSIFFTGLRGESLYQAKLENNSISLIHAHFEGEFGRLRAIVLGPDEFFYITTSNRDGRGIAREIDDRIIRINPKIFFE